MPLRARELSEQRGAWHTLGALRAAHAELEDRCGREPAISDAWRLPSGAFKPLRHWTDEVWPLLIYSQHLSLPDTQLVQLSEKSLRGTDWTLRNGDGSEKRFEVTTTYSYDDRLRSEMLSAEGSVSQFTKVARDRKTKRVVYTEPHCARDCSEAYADWRQRLTDALRKKQRDDYGAGVTLLVYAYGMSGDFERWREPPTIDEVLVLLPRDVLANGFDQTIVMSWHPGWIRTVA